MKNINYPSSFYDFTSTVLKLNEFLFNLLPGNRKRACEIRFYEGKSLRKLLDFKSSINLDLEISILS